MLLLLGIAAAFAWAYGAGARKYLIREGTKDEGLSIVFTKTPDREAIPGSKTATSGVYEGPNINPLTGESHFPIDEWRSEFYNSSPIEES